MQTPEVVPGTLGGGSALSIPTTGPFANVAKAMAKTSPEVEQQQYEGGATRSKATLRFDLIPPAAERALARRLALGVERHGERNWESGGAEFAKATMNHLKAHIASFQDEGKTEDLDAIICNAAFLCHFRAKEVI